MFLNKDNIIFLRNNIDIVLNCLDLKEVEAIAMQIASTMPANSKYYHNDKNKCGVYWKGFRTGSYPKAKLYSFISEYIKDIDDSKYENLEMLEKLLKELIFYEDGTLNKDVFYNYSDEVRLVLSKIFCIDVSETEKNYFDGLKKNKDEFDKSLSLAKKQYEEKIEKLESEFQKKEADYSDTIQELTIQLQNNNQIALNSLNLRIKDITEEKNNLEEEYKRLTEKLRKTLFIEYDDSFIETFNQECIKSKDELKLFLFKMEEYNFKLLRDEKYETVGKNIISEYILLKLLED